MPENENVPPPPTPGMLRTPSEILKSLPRTQAPQQQQANTSTSNAAINSAFAAARRAQLAELDKFDWDPLWRPVEHTINVLTSAGVGVVNALDKGIKTLTSNDSEKINDYVVGSIPVVGQFYNMYRGFTGQDQTGLWDDFQQGQYASMTNNTDSENYVLGHDLIENATDALGARFDPSYVDREDNVNKWVKGIGGFAIDVFADPVTYIPGGVIASGVRGGFRAAQALKGAGAVDRVVGAAKGIVKGTPNSDIKLGRWSGAVKPVGLEQWQLNRSLNKIDKVARKAGLTSEQAAKAWSTHTSKEGLDLEETAKRLNQESEDVLARTARDEPNKLKDAQANYRTDWDAAKLKAVLDEMGPAAKNLEEFWAARQTAGQVRAFGRRPTMKPAPSGASAYKHGSKKDQRIFDEQQMNMASGEATSSLFATIRNVDEGVAAGDPLAAKVAQEISDSTVAPYTISSADSAMERIDVIFEAAEGTTKSLMLGQRANIDNYDIPGLGENSYTFHDLLDAFMEGKNIGLTGPEAEIFGPALAEAMTYMHAVTRRNLSEVAEAAVKAEGAIPAPKPSVVPEKPVEAGSEVATEAKPAPEIVSEFTESSGVAAQAQQVPLTGAEPGTFKMLWDEALIEINSKEVLRLSNTVKSLEREIDKVYTTEIPVGKYRNQIAPTKGALVATLGKANVEAVIDTRPLPYMPAGKLVHLDKTMLGPELEAAGIKYHPLGEVVEGVERNSAIHAPGSPTLSSIIDDPGFVAGIDGIVEQLGGAKTVALLVFEGTGTFNRTQSLVSDALRARGINARVVLQRGAPQDLDTLNLIAAPLHTQLQSTQGLLSKLLRTGGAESVEEGAVAAQTILRASAKRQEAAVRKIMTEGDRQAWVGNVESMLGHNSKAYGSVEEEIAVRSNILTNLILSHQGEASDVVAKMLALGGAKATKRDVEQFFQTIFGSKKPVAESYSIEPVGGGIIDDTPKYVVTDPDIVVDVIRFLAELKTEIPGYTNKAREILAQIEAERLFPRLVRDEDTAEVAISAELGWVMRTYSAQFRDNPGAHINIFGEVVPGGEAGVATEMERAIENVGRQFLSDANTPALIATSDILEIWGRVTGANVIKSSNSLGSNVPVMRNTPGDRFGAGPATPATPANAPVNKATTRQVEGTGAGRGTAQGDAKDAAMRADSDAAIVETSPKAGKQSSSATTLAELGAPQGDMAGKTIMLARNGELSGQPLTEATEKAVSDAAQQGAKFVVGDMPKVDSAFHDLLNKLDAEYVIYHTGGTPRTGALAPAAAAPVAPATVGFGPIQERWLIGGKIEDITPEANALRAELSTPWKSPELNDIYDHVNGFAQTPIGSIETWVKSLMRVRYGSNELYKWKADAKLKEMRIKPELGLKENVTARQSSELLTNTKALKAWAEYRKAFVDKDTVSVSGWGVDIFGRAFYDRLPGVALNTKTAYKGITTVGKDAKYFGETLWKMSQKFEKTQGGIAYTDLEGFGEALTKRYGDTRAQELMGFVREIESVRLRKQADELVGRIEHNMSESLPAEQLQKMANDPLYKSTSGLDRLPENVRSIVIEAILRPSVNDVRASFFALNPRAVLDYVASRSRIDVKRYTIETNTRPTFLPSRFADREPEKWLPGMKEFFGIAKVKSLLDSKSVEEKLLGLLKDSALIKAAGKNSETLKGANLAGDVEKRGFKRDPRQYSDFEGRWYEGDGRTVYEPGRAGKVGRRIPDPNTTSRDVMDAVRREDLDEDFQLGFDNDWYVEWNKNSDPNINGFIHGVAHLLGLDPAQNRDTLLRAFERASENSGGAQGDFLLSSFKEEIVTGLENVKALSVRPATREEVTRVILNGEKIEGFTEKVVRKALGAKNGDDLIEKMDKYNPWYAIDEESIRAVMAVLENKPVLEASYLPSQIKNKSVRGMYDAAAKARIVDSKAISNYTVPDGEAIVAHAASLGTDGINQYIANAAIKTAAQIGQIGNQSARNEIFNIVSDAIKRGVGKIADTKQYTHFNEATAFTNIRGGLGVKFAANSPENWKAQMLARALHQSTLHQSGVFQTTYLHGKTKMYDVDFNGARNWAYLDWTDTYRAIANGNPEFDVFMREAENLIVGGQTFPQTLLPELGVYAMGLGRSKLAVGEKTFMLYDYAKTRLSEMKGYNAWADKMDAFATTDKAGSESFANAFISKLVTRLADEGVGTRLFETHLNNGAAALRVAETNSKEIVQPVVDRLLQVANSIDRSYATRGDAIGKSIDELRGELAKRNFGKNTAESLLSNHALQKFLVETFDNFDINGARHLHRMARAVQIGQDGVQELTIAQVLKRQQAVAKQQQAVGRMVNRRAIPDRMVGRLSAAETRLEKIRAKANEERARLASETMQMAKDVSVEDAISITVKAIEAGDEEALIMGVEKAINIGEHAIRTNLYFKDLFRAGSARLAAAEAAADAASKPPRETFRQATNVTPESERVVLSTQANTGLAAGVNRTFSGRGGMGDAKPIVSRIETAVDAQIAIGEKMMEGATKLVQKILGDETGVATNAWSARLLLATYGTKRYDFIANEVQPELAEAAQEMLKAWRVLLDTAENSPIVRSGLDTDHINESLLLGPWGFPEGVAGEAMKKYSLLAPGLMGWEVSQMLPKYLDDLLDPELGGRSALDVFKGLNYGLNKATLVPDLAAEFSAQFGHRSFGHLTAESAVAAGFKQIKSGPKSGTLAKWLDESQAYPPEFIRQLANVEKFLDYDTKFGKVIGGSGSKLVTALDRIVSVIKSSLTIWRPGHHVVSAEGDALMNTLAGVINPFRYYQAFKTMREAGQLRRGTIIGRDKNAHYGKFMSEYDGGPRGKDRGIRSTINGQQKTISYEGLYRMMDDAGLLINNNTAEDLLAHGDEITQAGGKLTNFFRPIVRANRSLGEFSARRDNVLRLAHAIDIIEKRGFRSINDLKDVVGREITEWHPTLQSLSGAERKYMRRLIFFYTWMRNATNKIFETMVENPRYITLAPKANVGISVGMGGDPQSFGQPMPNDPRLPEFAARNILGPSWYDEDGDIVGFTVNAPQLDILQDLLGKIAIDPNVSFNRNFKENALMMYRENTIGMASPIISTAMESLTGTEYKEWGQAPIRDVGEHLIDKTGLGIVSRATGRALINQNGFLAPRTDTDPNPEQAAQDRLRTGLNAVTGQKWTEWSQWYDVAARERTERQGAKLDELLKRIGN
jgi:hypothetical protein